MRFVVCDADTEYAQELRSELERAQLCSVFSNPECPEDFERLLKDVSFCADVFLIDADFGGESMGIRRTAHAVAEYYPRAQIIFMTVGVVRLHTFYEAPHCCAFIKRNYKQALQRAVEHAFRRLMKTRNLLRIANKGVDEIVNCDDIRYIERSGHVTLLRLGLDTKRVGTKLNELLPQLPRAQFVRCHESYIANLSYVKQLSAKSVMLSDGAQLPVSRQYRTQVRGHLMRYIGKSL